MITNELVGEVLRLQENCIFQVNIYNKNVRYKGYEVCFDSELGELIKTDETFYNDINLYEFIHLCKVWAEEKGYGILSSTEECYLIEFTEGLVAEWRYQPYMEIQAAQWLLDNRKELL